MITSSKGVMPHRLLVILEPGEPVRYTVRCPYHPEDQHRECYPGSDFTGANCLYEEAAMWGWDESFQGEKIILSTYITGEALNDEVRLFQTKDATYAP